MTPRSESLHSPLARRRLFALLSVLALFLAAAFIPYRQTFRAPFYLAPTATWKLRYDGSGQITGVWESQRLSGEVRSTLFQIERPDVADFVLSDGLKEGARVKAGETIGWVASRDLSHALRIAEAELEVARATEISLESGGRSEDVRVEEEALRAAEVALATYQPEFERVQDLYEKGLSSASEFQIVDAQMKAHTSNVELCRARLRAVKAGSRPVDVDVARAEVARLEATVLRAKSLMGEREDVKAPFPGILHLGGQATELLTLSRTDTLSAVLSMPESYAAMLRKGQSATFALFANPDHIFKAAIDTIEFAPADSVGLRAHAFIANDGELSAGMGGYAELESEKLTLLRSLRLRMGGSNAFRIF